MNYTELISVMFADQAAFNVEDNVLTGSGSYVNQEFALCGIVNNSPLSASRAQYLAEFFLTKSQENLKANIIIIVDTSGQQVTRHDELIGLNRYLAHLAKVIHFARSNGARVFSLVYGSALGGAFIATSLNAERIYALSEAKIAVMWLEAMARVTKVPLDKLKNLSKTSPIFAPGAENFVKLGAIEKVITINELMPKLVSDLSKSVNPDHWRKNGKAREGRMLADKVVEAILNA